MRNKILLLLFLALTAAGLTGSAFPLTVSITGQTPVNQCEADTYYITVENPSWQTETAENIVITNTIPADGFVFQADSAIITTLSGSWSGTAANPTIVDQDCTWDLDALFGDIYLTPGQSLDIEFNMEIDCAGDSGEDDLILNYDFPSPNAQSDTGDLFISVLFGDINVIKSPVTQEASRGDWTTFTLKIESSGLGSIKNVEVRDTLGSGLSFFAADPVPGSNIGSTYYWTADDISGLAEMVPDAVEWITLTAIVNSCTGLDNSLNASFGCESMVSVFDTICLDTETESPVGTAAATIDYQLKPPSISFDLSPSMTGIDYCSQTNVTVAVTNGDPVTPDPDVGEAFNLVFDTNIDTTGYDITGVVGASYAAGDFTVGTVPANDTVYFSYDIGWPNGSCPPNGSTQNTLWRPMYDDQCNNPFAPPVGIFPISMNGLPSLSITKNDPGIVDGSDTIIFNVSVTYHGPDGFTPTITDDYPNPSPYSWRIENITEGGIDDNDKIIWTPTLNDGDTWNASFDMVTPGMPGDPCQGPPPGLYTNDVDVTVGTDCRTCAIPADSHSVTFAVEDTIGCQESPTPTVTATPIPTPSTTPTPDGYRTPSPTPSSPPTPSPSLTPISTATPPATPPPPPTPPPTPPTPTPPPTPIPTSTPPPPPPPTPTPTPTLPPTPTPIPTSTPPPTPIPPPTPSPTLTPVPTATPTLTPVPTPSTTLTPIGYETPTPSPSATPTMTVTPSPSTTPTSSPTPLGYDSCIAGVVLSGGGTTEVCTSISYTADYTFGGSSDLPDNWLAALFTGKMELDQRLPFLDSVIVDGFNY